MSAPVTHAEVIRSLCAAAGLTVKAVQPAPGSASVVHVEIEPVAALLPCGRRLAQAMRDSGRYYGWYPVGATVNKQTSWLCFEALTP